jgi:hypothetical protein
LCSSRPSGPTASSGGLLLFTLPARCAARRVRPPFAPLGWRPSPAVPSPCLSRRARGLRPPLGLPPAFLREGSGGPWLGLGRSAPPRVVGVQPPMPAVPLAVSGPKGGPLAWRPPQPPQSPQRARPDPPQGPGVLPTPGPPLRSSRRGRAAAARVGTLCASAGRWGSPRIISWPTAVCPCVTLWLCVPHGRLRRGPEGRSSLALSPLRGLYP